MLFKVARYRGALTDAEAHLRRALALRRAAADDAGCAATLHELGVVALRRADWAKATALLRRSLDAKRQLPVCAPSPSVLRPPRSV